LSSSGNQSFSIFTIVFALLLLTPFIFPGFFPFDVNILLATSASWLFAYCYFYHYKIVYVPKSITLSFAFIAMIQYFVFISGSVLAPEAWKLHCIQYFAIFVMLGIGASVPASSLQRWMHIYIIAAVAWSLVGLFVWLGGTGGMPLSLGLVSATQSSSLKLSGPFSQGNIFASMIGMAWIFSHWLFLKEKKPVHLAAIILFSAIMFDTLSRGGWIAFIPCLTLLLLALKPSPHFIATRLSPAWILALILGLFLYKISQPQLQSGQMFPLIDTAGASLSARLAIWATAIVEFLNHPLTGAGWGQFAAATWHSRPQAFDWAQTHFGIRLVLDSVPMSAHNMWLHILAESGVIAFFLIFRGSWHITKNTISLLQNAHSHRLPFALASSAFLLQSFINISFSRPVPILVFAFFTGIAFAPWLRAHSWKFQFTSLTKYAALTVTIVIVSWSSYQINQWFLAASSIRSFDIANNQSVKNMARFADQPRVGALPTLWLGYTIASKNRHTGLLTWMIPFLKHSLNELPWVDTYQVLFYALLHSQRYDEACHLGMMISKQHLQHEKNDLLYQQVCAKKHPGQAYSFGH